MKKIIFFDTDPEFNCLRIVTPLEASIDKIVLPHTATKVRVVDESEIPSDRTFRNAWTHELEVDMTKARNIWRDKMRAARAPKLEALDVAYQRADEVGDKAQKALVALEKQKLRDITARQEIDNASTPEELKNFWPSEL